MDDRSVRPNVSRLTDSDARHLLADGLIRACHVKGPSRVALEIGCDEKTVRRARDEDSTLGLACSWNLLDVDEHALDALAAAKGFRFVRLSAAEGPDVITTAGAVIHKLGIARSPNSPGGVALIDEELLGMESEAAALEEAAAHLRSTIALLRLKMAA